MQDCEGWREGWEGEGREMGGGGGGEDGGRSRGGGGGEGGGRRWEGGWGGDVYGGELRRRTMQQLAGGEFHFVRE